MVKISVIIPLYNVENFIEETLNSLLNQTIIDDIEVLMIDDGSTDNSRYIIEKYALDYDNFYAFHKENEGQGVARNFGLKKAKGEYIHFLDADDFITPDAYEKLYELRSKFSNSISRIFYFFETKDGIVVLSGYLKKDNKTDKKELDRAFEYMKDYLERSKKNE